MMRSSAIPAVPISPAQGRRIKVVLVTVGLGVGGTEGQVLELASRLDPARFDVLVCVLKEEDVLAAELRARSVRVVLLDGKGPWDVRVLYRLIRLVHAAAPDLIHSFLSPANLASRLAGRACRVPVVISSYRDREIWKSGLDRLADRSTLGWMRAATCCSEAVRQFVAEHLGGESGKLLTIHNGVDVARFAVRKGVSRAELGLREDLPVIGTVCRLVEPKKGLAVLVKALARLNNRAETPPCQVLIVGEGPAERPIRALCDELGVTPWVAFTGLRRDVPRILPSLDVFVLPSRYEGFGIAIVEAMAAGLPVVASKVGGIPEIIIHGETGLLVPPDDPGSLADALRELTANPERAKAMGQRGRQRAQALFSVEAMVKRHEDLYERLLASRAQSPAGR
jgi:glycosyltransferase involved in cell wall biosynthesis